MLRLERFMDFSGFLGYVIFNEIEIGFGFSTKWGLFCNGNIFSLKTIKNYKFRTSPHHVLHLCFLGQRFSSQSVFQMTKDLNFHIF